MTQPSPAPRSRSVVYLGYGGALPFIFLPILAFIDASRAALWLDLLRNYGVVILSFVGALHWAFAMTLPELSDARRNRLYVWSVIPALLGWFSTVLVPWAAVSLLISGYALHYSQDRTLVSQSALPAWYLPLRRNLTTIACIALLSGALLK